MDRSEKWKNDRFFKTNEKDPNDLKLYVTNWKTIVFYYERTNFPKKIWKKTIILNRTNDFWNKNERFFKKSTKFDNNHI